MIVKDPYGNPVQGQEVDFSYNYSKWFDLSDNENHGQIYGAQIDDNVTIGETTNLTALGFDGVDDYVNVSDSVDLDPQGGDFTVEVWFKANETSDFALIGKGAGSIYWQFAFYDNRLYGWFSDGTNSPSGYLSPVLTIGEWYFVVMVLKRSDNTCYGYVNGELSGYFDTTGLGTVDSTDELFIGADRTKAFYFNGSIALMRIYNRALNSTEIDLLHDYIYYKNVSQATYESKINNGCVLRLENHFLINQSFASATTDSNGFANVTFTLPDEDAVLYLHANTSGNYAGIKSRKIYSTSITYSWGFDHDIIHRGNEDYVRVYANYSVDNSPLTGSAYVNETEITIINGQGNLDLDTGQSGYYDYVLKNISDGLITIQPNEVKTLKIAGLNYEYSEDPVMPYKLINSNTTITVKVYYDDGLAQYKYPSNLTVYFNYTCSDGTVFQHSNETSAGLVTDVIFLGENESISVAITVIDIDSSELVIENVIYTNAINVSSYSLSGDLERTEFSFQLKVRHGVIGSYRAGIYLLDNESAAYELDLFEVGNRSLTQLDSVTFSKQLVKPGENVSCYLTLTNFNSSTRLYNVSIQLYDLYEAVDSVSLNNLKILPNNLIQPEFNLTISTTKETPLWISIEVLSDDGEYISAERLSPLVITRNDSFDKLYVKYYEEFSSSDFTNKYQPSFTYTNLKDYLSAWNENYVCLKLENNIKLTIQPEFFKRLSLPEMLTADLDLTVEPTLAESGDQVTVTANISSSYAFTADVELICGEVSLTQRNVEIASTKLVNFTFTAPQTSLLSWRDFSVNVKIIESQTQREVASSATTLSVFNQGPIIELVSPEEGSTLNGTVTFDLNIYDAANEVDSVTYRFDWESAWHNLTSPYDFEFDTNSTENGRIILYVRATDSNGFMSERSFYFVVYNPVKEAAIQAAIRGFIDLMSKYAFIPALVLIGIFLVLSYVFARIIKGKPKQPIVVKVEAEKLKKAEKKK
ncbi:MAG: LamG domain-containing protein [Candidatus Odinarchaeia archaeon]